MGSVVPAGIVSALGNTSNAVYSLSMGIRNPIICF